MTFFLQDERGSDFPGDGENSVDGPGDVGGAAEGVVVAAGRRQDAAADRRRHQ